MLEKSSENPSIFYTDAHFHPVQCGKYENIPELLRENFPSGNYSAMSCVLSKEEYENFLILQENIPQGGESLPPASNLRFSASPSNGKNPVTPSLNLSFGVHPQEPETLHLDFLESLLSSESLSGKKIDAIGECGFDFFTEEFSRNREKQLFVFDSQLSLSEQYKKPLIIHNRKGFEELFSFSSSLKKAPSVIFHGFSGGVPEARSILNKGINAYFSFGKVLMRGSTKAFSVLEYVPEDRILFETDSPYMTLKGESFSSFCDIKKVYERAFRFLSEKKRFSSISELSFQVKENYGKAFLQNNF